MRAGPRSCLAAVALTAGMAILGGCEAPPEVVSLRDAPQATRDAMLRIQVLPLGMPAPPGVGALGPITGLGCGQTSTAASGEAVEQLRVKGLRMHATAVMDVVIGPSDPGACYGRYGAVANGIAVAPRGLPSSY